MWLKPGEIGTPFYFEKKPCKIGTKVTEANAEMVKFVFVRQPAAGDRAEPSWSRLECCVPVGESEETPNSNEHVDGYDAMVIFLARTMPRRELQVPAEGSDRVPGDGIGRRQVLLDRARSAARTAAEAVQAVEEFDTRREVDRFEIESASRCQPFLAVRHEAKAEGARERKVIDPSWRRERAHGCVCG